MQKSQSGTVSEVTILLYLQYFGEARELKTYCRYIKSTYQKPEISKIGLSRLWVRLTLFVFFKYRGLIIHFSRNENLGGMWGFSGVKNDCHQYIKNTGIIYPYFVDSDSNI